jgi:threonine dehydratase
MIMSLTRADVVAAAERLAGRVRRTPLIEAHALSATTGRAVWLKLETLQQTRSFKYRGALNAVLALSQRTDTLPTLVTASAGNHGLALATAASAAGASLLVYAPRTTPAAKLERMRRPGVRVDTSSRDYDEAEARAVDAAARGAGTYVSPYNHPDVIAGAGTVALEILEDLPSPGGIIVPTGGGGLLSGMALAARDTTLICGVEPEVNPAFSVSLAAGHVTAIESGASLADGLLGNLEAGSITFELVRAHASGVRTVPERFVVQGVRALFRQERLVAEGAGAIAVGALLGGVLDDVPDPLVLVVSGANIDTKTLLEAIAA